MPRFLFFNGEFKKIKSVAPFNCVMCGETINYDDTAILCVEAFCCNIICRKCVDAASKFLAELDKSNKGG
jgi:hypothetical protein